MEEVFDLLHRLENNAADIDNLPNATNFKIMVRTATQKIREQHATKLEEAREEMEESIKYALDNIKSSNEFIKYFSDQAGNGCSICLLPFCTLQDNVEPYTLTDPNNPPMETTCGHLFHIDCLLLHCNNGLNACNCPYCRQPIMPIANKYPECQQLVTDMNAAITLYRTNYNATIRSTPNEDIGRLKRAVNDIKRLVDIKIEEEKQLELVKYKEIADILLRTAHCLVQCDGLIGRNPHITNWGMSSTHHTYIIPNDISKYYDKPIQSEHLKYYIVSLNEMLKNHNLIKRFSYNINKSRENLLRIPPLVIDYRGGVREKQDKYLTTLDKAVTPHELFYISPKTWGFQSGTMIHQGQDMRYYNWRDDIKDVILRRIDCFSDFLQLLPESNYRSGGKSRKRKSLRKNKHKTLHKPHIYNV